MAKVRHESARHRAAFEYYYGLGGKRSYKKVAERFDVSERAVNNWSKNFNWRQRVYETDVKVNDRLDENLVQSSADMRVGLANTLFLLLRDNFIQKAREKNGLVDFKITSIKDVQVLIKLLDDLIAKLPETTTGKEEGPTRLRGLSHKDRKDIKDLLGMLSAGDEKYNGGKEQHDDPKQDGDAPFQLTE